MAISFPKQDAKVTTSVKASDGRLVAANLTVMNASFDIAVTRPDGTTFQISLRS